MLSLVDFSSFLMWSNYKFSLYFWLTNRKRCLIQLMLSILIMPKLITLSGFKKLDAGNLILNDYLFPNFKFQSLIDELSLRFSMVISTLIIMLNFRPPGNTYLASWTPTRVRRPSSAARRKWRASSTSSATLRLTSKKSTTSKTVFWQTNTFLLLFILLA